MLKRLSSGVITPKDVSYEYHVYFYPENTKRYDKKIGIKRCQTETEAKKLVTQLTTKNQIFDVYDKEICMRIYITGVKGVYKIKREKINLRASASF